MLHGSSVAAVDVDLSDDLIGVVNDGSQGNSMASSFSKIRIVCYSPPLLKVPSNTVPLLKYIVPKPWGNPIL